MAWISPVEEQRRVWAFWLGGLLVTLGVLLHLPMWWMARGMGFRLAGMPMGPEMYLGMAAIVLGIAGSFYGLYPGRRAAAEGPAPQQPTSRPAGRDGLVPAHWILILVLVVALIIDTMKAATLGFIVPGVRTEYGLSKPAAAMLPLIALSGTVLGSFVWGGLADLYGRKASVLLAAIMFIGTSICGAMPSFGWNLAMCFLMGCAVGGMLPATYALLTETMPTRHRGWSLVLVGGLGTAGGYLAASALSALLQPHFGWRVMWLVGLPTGVALVFLSGLVPESPRFLIAHGLKEAAGAVRLRYRIGDDSPRAASVLKRRVSPARVAGTAATLTFCALGWGTINFGVLLWLPARLASQGLDVASSSALLSKAALIALPTTVLAALLYSRWSAKGALVLTMVATLLALACMLQTSAVRAVSPVLLLGLLLVGVNGLFAILLPYAAEIFPQSVRGSATGWVAGCTKAGGVFAQLLILFAAGSAWRIMSSVAMAALIGSVVLLGWFGQETRGRELRELEATLQRET